MLKWGWGRIGLAGVAVATAWLLMRTAAAPNEALPAPTVDAKPVSDGGHAPVVAVAQPQAAASAAPHRAARSAPVFDAEPGSEGYAPAIIKAMNAGNAADAMKAARWLSRCKSIDHDLAYAYQMGADPKMRAHPEVYKSAVENFEGIQRRCQTVTPELLAARPQLLLKAAEGQVPGAGTAYVAEMSAELSRLAPTQREQVLAALRADGRNGDSGALMMLFTDSELGLSESASARRVYKAAYQAISVNEPNYIEAILRKAFEVMQLPESEWSTLSFFAREPVTDDIRAEVERIVQAHQRQQRPGG